MNYRVVTIPPFDKQLKRLAKKYPSLRHEYLGLVSSLETNPDTGTPLGKHCFKIRLAIASKGKGRSGGARVITHLYVTGSLVYLLAIYDKSEKADLSNKELEQLLSLIAP